MNDRREQTIRELLEMRDSSVEDIRTMAPQKNGTLWHTDRIREIQACNRRLQLLGVLPSSCVVD
jgi:hypothetical protein